MDTWPAVGRSTDLVVVACGLAVAGLAVAVVLALRTLGRSSSPGSTTVRDVRATTHRRGVPSAEIPPSDLDGTLFPFLATAGRSPGRLVRLWVYGDEAGLPSGSLGLSTPTRRYIDAVEDGSRVVLRVPERIRLKVILPPALDIPHGTTVHVGPQVFDGLAVRGRGERALVTTANGVALPVRLVRRDIESRSVRMPMSLRTLCGIPADSVVQVSALPRSTGWEWRARTARRVFTRAPRGLLRRQLGVVLGVALATLRLFDYVLELVLRLALRSQPMCFRVTQANPGDDDLRETIRLHPSAFNALALQPGGQVILGWGDQRVAVRALEDHSPITDRPSPHVMHSVGLHLDEPALPEGFPAHLVARVPASVRRGMNIPPNTVVEVRRRLRPAVVSQLNQLTVPTAGLVVGAAAFPAVRGWPLVVGAAAALVLGLAPIRMPRPPRGQWP